MQARELHFGFLKASLLRVGWRPLEDVEEDENHQYADPGRHLIGQSCGQAESSMALRVGAKGGNQSGHRLSICLVLLSEAPPQVRLFMGDDVAVDEGVRCPDD